MGHRLAVLAGMLLVVTAVPVMAQSQAMRVNVPFAFTIGDQVHPAGNYVVTSSNDPRGYILRGPTIAFVSTNSVDSKVEHQPSLVFVKSGEQYSLAQMWTEYGHLGHALFASSSKRNKNLPASAQTVEVLEKPGLQAHSTSSAR